MSQNFSADTHLRTRDQQKTPYRVPGDATGLRILITGANAGIGFWTSLQLAQRGAEVIMACRDETKATIAADAIRARVPGANLRLVTLDLARLDSVSAAVGELADLEHLDGLIANAGIVHPPRTRRQSEDGLELVAATNFFGHFALVAGLLPTLERAVAARVLTLGSLATLLTRPHLEDPQLVEHYSSWRAYARSKIMVQSFAFELDSRLRNSGSKIRALSAHPGYSISGRTPILAGINEPSTGKRAAALLQGAFSQGKQKGAWPVVRAMLDPDAFATVGPVFYGPKAVMRGGPSKVTPVALTTDPVNATLIWDAAEAATGLTIFGGSGAPFGAASAS